MLRAVCLTQLGMTSSAKAGMLGIHQVWVHVRHLHLLLGRTHLTPCSQHCSRELQCDQATTPQETHRLRLRHMQLDQQGRAFWGVECIDQDLQVRQVSADRLQRRDGVKLQRRAGRVVPPQFYT